MNKLVMQIVNGKPRLATYALLLLIGPAVGFAGLQIGLKRCIGGVEKVKKLCGVLLSEEQFQFLSNPGRWRGRV